jgi:hypothetical protein
MGKLSQCLPWNKSSSYKINSMDHSPLWEADSHSADEEILQKAQ